MKKQLFLFLLISALFAFGLCKAQTLTTLTFNLRYDNPDDGKNAWDLRKQSVANLIVHYNPQIFGVQEGLHQMLLYLKENLGTYNFIGVGREDGKEKGEYSAIFYDSTQYKVIESSTFWLSNTPEKVSVGWDAALERICTYGLFQNIESGKYVWVFNTHFDHMGKKARKNSAELIIQKINELNTEKYPVILMGDFNTTPESEPIQTLKSHLLETSLVAEKPLYGPAGTFNGFEEAKPVTECIDFIFVSKLRVLSCTHIDDKKNDALDISDHYPVMAELEFYSSK
jgi:endonuclease/exonuclease/phosphatase family metal-dependent hydrolase